MPSLAAVGDERLGPADDNVGHAGTATRTKEDPMSDLQAIADRVEIEALRAEFTDAVMMHDYDRLASLFTQDGTVLLPHAYAGAIRREDMRAGGEQLQALLDYLVQTTHPGTIMLDGDTASGRAYMSELTRFRDGRSELNYGIYHDRYQRSPDGWKFTERVYEIRYLDATPLAGSAPQPAGDAANP
jgi:ketosteroid isomerase-like protein